MSGINAFRATYSKHIIEPAIIIAPVKNIYPVAQDCFVAPFDLFK